MVTPPFTPNPEFQASPPKLDGLSKHEYLTEIARLHLQPNYLHATQIYLQHHTQLLERLVEHLSGIAFAPYSTQLQPDTQLMDSALHQWLKLVFDHNHLWEALSREVWANLLAWTVQDLEKAIATAAIHQIAQEPYREEIWESVFNPDLPDFLPILSQLEHHISQDLADQIWANPQTLDPFLLGLPFAEIAQTLTLPTLTLGKYLVQAEPTQFLSEELAQTEVPSVQTNDLTQNDAIGLFPIHLEHYLTRPSELYRLPWELLAQVRQQCGLEMVQLLLLIAGHAQRQSMSPLSPFTLNGSEILEQLDWHPAQPSVQSPDLFALFGQLSTLTITSIWMTDVTTTQAEAFKTRGHPWEVLSELQGPLDWNTGQIATLTVPTFTLNPGLWLHHLLRQGGLPARSACTAFSTIALKLLQLDYCRDPLLLSLLITLSLNAPEPHPDPRAMCYTVQTLLEAALSVSTPPTLLQQPDLALSLFQSWNQSLEALLKLGWSNGRSPLEAPTPLQFYVPPYPDWLNFTRRHPGAKPHTWVEQWLAQPLQFYPPTDWMYGSVPLPTAPPTAAPASPYRPLRRLRFDRLTGSEIRVARKAKQLTQSQLAEALHVHQSLIAKIEAGRRSVTEELEGLIRKTLDL